MFGPSISVKLDDNFCISEQITPGNPFNDLNFFVADQECNRKS